MSKRKKLKELRELRDELQTQYDIVDSCLKSSPEIIDRTNRETLNEYRFLIIQRLNDILGDKSR